MALFKKYDFWSIQEELDKMIEFDYKRYDYEHSEYFDEFEEQAVELANIAGDFYSEMQAIKENLWCRMPDKKIDFCEEDECSQTSIAWFNTAAAMLADTDMRVLLESENVYAADENEEKAKRIRALQRLTKEQQLYLFTTVMGFIVRFQDLQLAFESIKSVVDELDRHQALLQNTNGEYKLPESAYVA